MDLLMRKDVAERLDVSLPTADRLIARSDFPKIRIGRSVRVPSDMLDDWIREHVGGAVELHG